MASEGAQPLTETYLELRDDGSVGRIVVTPEFWPDLTTGKRRIEGRLVMAFELSEDTAHWEKHPSGDEVLLMLSGAVTVVLEEAAGEQRVDLSAGEAYCVPRDTWHRIEVREAGKIVFMTAGEGTEHKPRDLQGSDSAG